MQAVGEVTPREKYLTPEQGDGGVEVGEVTIREEEGGRVVWKGGVREADPMEG